MTAEGAEIHWQSYAHTDDRQALWKPYQERVAQCGATAASPPTLEISRDDQRLELFEASSGGHPKCNVAPSPEHKTVIVISKKQDRPK